LKNTIAAYDSMYRSLLLQAEKKDSVINRSNQKMTVWHAAINDLQVRVSNYETLNLQTQKNNRILILFNSVVCLLLFLMLIRYLLNLRKKKSGSFQKKDQQAAAAGISNPDALPQQNKIAYKLDQLERLGKLRNLGVLTEGEFILQKQIILEN
jgi:flagellar biosynthesis/type III secretory pathway M-ring protein FliF/YscJ